MGDIPGGVTCTLPLMPPFETMVEMLLDYGLWTHVECNYKYGATYSLTIFYVGAIVHLIKNIHVALEFFHVQSEADIQIKI